MKLTRHYYLLMLVILTGLSSCDKDDDMFPQLGDDPRNLGEILAAEGSLTTFSEAIVQTEMDETLRTTTTYTVLAPNNQAFEGVNLSEYSEEELNNLVLNHLVNTVTADFSQTLSTGYRPTMASGPNGTTLSLFTNTANGITFNGMASLVSGSSDIGSTNGVLHVLDAVLTPPTVVDHLQANPEFSTFAEAVELADLTDLLATNDTENDSYPFTVFAPTNAAFENLLSELNGAFGWENLSDIPAEFLQEIVMFHIVTGNNAISAELMDSEQTTLQGDLFTINAESVISDGSYTTTSITLTDVQGINGVIHGIDRVLLTEHLFQQVLDVTLNIRERSEDRGYSSFLAAVEKVGLNSALESDELTAFIPNNEAFEAFFSTITNFESLDDFDTEEELDALRALVNYHLHAGVLMSSQLSNGQEISTLHGDVITADLTGDNARLRASYSEALPSIIVNANVGATNGIIHGINRVLVPADLANVFGFPSDEGGHCPVGDENLVFFDWDEFGSWWGNVSAENNAALSIDGSNYGRANFQTGGTGWVDLFWRNDAGTFRGAQIVGDNLNDYVLKFDINVQEPISAGAFRIRFNNSNGVDAFYDWQPWAETGEPFTTDGWETVEIPLTALGVPDFSLVNAEFGMAFEGADVLLNFAIDNVRFDTPGCGGPDPVADPEAVFFDWDENGSWWGNVAAENDPSISLDGSNYGRANFQTGGTGWVDLFWRNDASTFHGADMVGTNVDDYVLKFDIATFEPITDGAFRIRFNNSAGVDAFYDWAPWEDTGEPFHTEGEWVTVSIPVSALGQPDFSAVNAEFGMAFEGADILLDFAIDNVRFEEK